jgi:hypothetical protein
VMLSTIAPMKLMESNMTGELAGQMSPYIFLRRARVAAM